MEEVTREIALSLSIKTILISILAAGGTIAIATILKPLILIIRDLTAWRIIESLYSNKDKKSKIEKLFRFKRRLETQFHEDTHFDEHDEGVAAYIADKPTEAHFAFIYDAIKEHIKIEIIELEEEIERNKKRLSFILQHLGMQEIENPLTTLEAKYQKHYESNLIRDVKIDYDLVEFEALKEIKKNL
ncbi:hypothetical protein ACT3RU_06870 [Halomonas sp. TP35]